MNQESLAFSDGSVKCMTFRQGGQFIEFSYQLSVKNNNKSRRKL
jgi:hypothetical protein